MKDIKLPWVNAGERLPVEGNIGSLFGKQKRDATTKYPLTSRWFDESTNTLTVVRGHSKDEELSLSQIEWLDESPEAVAKVVESYIKQKFNIEKI